VKYGLQDATLNTALALPNGAATTTSAAIDLQNGTHGDFVAPVQFTLTVPAVTTSMLPDAGTITYDIYTSPNSDLSGSTKIISGLIVQTGAGGAGAAGASADFRVPTSVGRYLFYKAVKSGTGNASTVSATLNPAV
jgi:hypothetical protein